MRLEIDIPEHQYNNIMSIDSISLGRAPYKGIIMYAINAIKQGKVLEQEPTTKNNLGVEYISRSELMAILSDYYDTTVEYRSMLKEIAALPSVTPQEPQTFKWCTDCKEYDQEKHYCPRYCKVIRRTVEEMKQEPRKGHWLSQREHCEMNNLRPSGIGSYFWCSECNHAVDVREWDRNHYNYCPNCGADMREVEK